MNSIKIASYLALRRLLPSSHTPGASLLPKLAFSSIVIGVAASILILSLANGLHFNYLSRLAGKDAHIVVRAPSRGIPNYELLVTETKKIPGILDVFPYAQSEALLKSSYAASGVLLKALPPYFAQDKAFNQLFRLIEGTWSLAQPRTLTVGETLAKSMGLFIGDYLDILLYDADLGSVTYRFRVSGIFAAGDAGLDTSIVFIAYSDADEIFALQKRAPYLGIMVQEPLSPEKYLPVLKDVLPFDNIYTWRSANINSIYALDNEKQIIRVLLLIFFCVAFFGILAVMTALVADKREEIALLKVLGMRPSEDVLSFILTGFYLGGVSSLIGAVFGVVLSIHFNRIVKFIETIISFITKQTFTFLNQNVYYLSEFPVRIRLEDIIFSMVSASLCVLLASLYPAGLAKKFRPAEILRKD